MRAVARWLGELWIYLLPVAMLAAFIIVGTTVHQGRIFCEEPEIDLQLPSEAAIPEADPARAISEQDPTWRFRYAPTGTEGRAGIPYWIFRAMPGLFPEKLPDGYHTFGFDDDDQDYYRRRLGDSKDGRFRMPRGTVVVDTDFTFPLYHFKLLLKRVALNCSACHRGEYMKDGQRHLVDGMPNGVADLQAFKMLFGDAVQDDRFTPANIIAEIDRLLVAEGAPPLNAREHLVYDGIVDLMKAFGSSGTGDWQRRFGRPLNGPGRIDPFNAIKFEVLKVPDDGTAATLDFPSLWNQRASVRSWHHYDGNTNDSEARNYGSVIGVGGMATTINKPSIIAVGDWIDKDLRPPAWPFGTQAGDAQKGRALFDGKCAHCHGSYDPATAAATWKEGDGYMKIHDLDTDDQRWMAFPLAAAQTLNRFGDQRGLWRADAFRPAGKGYLAGPLDGIWARAPYLHNGSVPTLDDLLRDPKSRPTTFCRGNPEYDPVKVGFVWQALPTGQCARAKYDTTLPGNHNSGHAMLPANDAERTDLLAYLRTL